MLNKPDQVNVEMKQRVAAAIRELGFVPNRSARQLRMGSSMVVGLVLRGIAGPYFEAVALGVEERLADAGFSLMLCSSHDQIETEQRHLALLEEQGVRGVLVAPTNTDLSALDALRSRGTAVVLLERQSPRTDACSVSVDDVTGGEIAASHLLEQGHRRLCLLNGPDHIPQCVERREGVRRAVIAAGLSYSEAVHEIIVPSLDATGGEAAMAQLVGTSSQPSAVVCVNDPLALGAMRGLATRGVSVPNDVAVVGYDDIEFASMLAPSLTSVRRPKNELGVRAAQLLLEEINGGPDHLHQQIKYQPELVVRDSSLHTRR